MERVVAVVVAMLLIATACSGGPSAGESSGRAASSEPTPASTTESPADLPDDPAVGQPKPEPVPFITAGQPGSAQALDELVAELREFVPTELRSQVPWPDLRNPDPVVAQIEIFNLWIWINENHPDPRLGAVMAVPGSESSEKIAGIFGAQKVRNEFQTRNGPPYRAFDHVAITFESAGLPLWLARGAPADAVVVYYSDNSGPVDITDRDTGAFLEEMPATPTRSWLSIMVPTEVGWRLWRDQLLDPSNGLEFPEVPPAPSKDDDQRSPQV